MIEDSQKITRKELIEILRVGLQAVSPYNAQPWEFKFQDGQLLVYTRHNDRGFWKCKDVIFHTLGAFLENLSEGAKAFHYEIIFKHVTDNKMNMTRPVCEVSFKKTSEISEYDVKHVMTRYTNRKIYRPDPVPLSILEQIRAIFDGPNRKVLDVTGQGGLINNCAVLERIRITNHQIRDELMEILSFTPEEAKKRRWGLDIRVLELPFHVQNYLQLNRNLFFRTLIDGSYFVKLFGVMYFKKHLLGTPLLLAFQEADHSPENIVRDWMNIQKILNFLHKEGLCSHLVASSVDIVKINPSFLSPREIKIIAQANTKIEQKTGMRLESLLTLLRVGYAQECQFKALRKDPEELFLKD